MRLFTMHPLANKSVQNNNCLPSHEILDVSSNTQLANVRLFFVNRFK